MICPTCNNTPQKRGFDDKGKQRYWCRTCDKWYREEVVVVQEEKPKSASILFLDIETLPLDVVTWGIHEQHINHKQIIRDWCILSWAAMWIGDEEPFSDFLTSYEAIHRNDKRLVENLWKIMDKADIIVAHNGNGFDIPKIKGRFLYHRMGNPSPFKSVDTLMIARQKFGLTSNKLDFILNYLGYEGKIETDFQLWLNCRIGREESIQEMDRYCRGDVSKLREVYMAMRPYMTSNNHPNVNLWKEEQDGKCPICGSDKIKVAGKEVAATYLYDAYKCDECGAWHRSRKKNL